MPRLTYTIPVADATLNEWNVADSVAPNQMTVLSNYLSDKGAIVPRPHTRRLILDTNEGAMASVSGSAVTGCYAWNGGSDANWFLMAVVESSGNTRMVALLLDFEQTNPANILRNVIASPNMSTFANQRWAFHEHRGRVFASNGFEVFVFDGVKWRGPNQWVDDTWRRCGSEVAFRCAVEFQARTLLCNNKIYPNERLWSKPLEDWDEKTTWPGVQNLGGFEVKPIATLRTLAFADSSAYLGGDTGAFYYSYTRGRSWTMAEPPSATDDIKLLAAYEKYAWMIVKSGTGGGYALHYTDDYGRGWEERVCPPLYSMGTKMQFIDSSNGFVAGSYNWGENPAVFITDDGGQSWSPSALPATDELCYGVDMLTTDSGFAVSTSEIFDRGNIFQRSSGTWLASLKNTTYKLYAVSALNVNHIIAVGADGKVCVGKYENEAWSFDETDTAGDDFYAVTYYKSGHAVAVGKGGACYYGKIEDTGTWSWNTPTTAPATVDYFDVAYDGIGRLLAVGSGGTTYYSDDDGGNWYELTADYDKFVLSDTLSPNEEIRAACQLGRDIVLATDRNAYVYDQQMAQIHVQPGVEVLNHRCLLEWAGALWFAGCYNGVPGIYTWDTQTAPKLMSRPVQTTINTLTWQPAPRNLMVKLDTQGEFTQPESAGDAVGLYYDTSEFTLKDGVLRKNRTANQSWIYSHANRSGTASNTTGYYFPDMSSSSTFGTLALEIAMNDETSSDYSHVQCQVCARAAYGSPGGTLTWTGWSQLVPESFNYMMPETNQNEVFGRFVMRVDHTQFSSYDSGQTYKWLQFKIAAVNNPDADEKSTWALNRICIIPQVNPSGYSPSMLVWDDKLWFHFGGDSIVFSDGGAKVATADFNVCPDDSATLGGRMLLVGQTGDGTTVQVEYTNPNYDDYQTLQARVRSGRIDFGTVDPKYGGIRKTLRRIIVKGKPSHAASATLALAWWPDGRSGQGSSINLKFHSAHDPDHDRYQVRVVECHSAPASYEKADGVNYYTPNFGHDFTVQVTSSTAVDSTVDIKQITLEVEPYTEDVEATDAEA